jgi:hypothetical protein
MAQLGLQLVETGLLAEELLNALQDRGMVGTPEWEIADQLRKDIAGTENIVREFMYKLKAGKDAPLTRHVRNSQKELQRLGALPGDAKEAKEKDDPVAIRIVRDQETQLAA